MAAKLKWGVVGSGGIAQRRTIPEGIVPARNADLRLVYDVAPEINAEVSRKFGARAAGSIEELLASDVDAVYIATPAHLHYQQAIQCARAKKHVLCEKPLGLTVEEAADMVTTFRDENICLGVGFMMRFASQHQEALDLVRAGKLGKLVFGRAQLSCWYPLVEGAWRQIPEQGGGGSLMDMGGHCIDLLEMFFGKVKQVSCFTNTTVHAYKSEDCATALLVFENGALGTVDAFFCIPDNSSKNALELYGSEGSIIAQGTVGQEATGTMRAYLDQTDQGYNAQQQRAAAAGTPIAPRPVNTYLREIEEFSQAVLDGSKPANNGELGLQSQKVLAACYASARSGRSVEIR